MYKYAKAIENDDDDDDSSDERGANLKRSPLFKSAAGVKAHAAANTANKRSPIVFPRIGVQKKSAIFQPRIGRDSPSDSLDIIDEKRSVIYQPRIGRK